MAVTSERQSAEIRPATRQSTQAKGTGMINPDKIEVLSLSYRWQ
ncbi:MAG TPA: hypothetical protein VEI52_17095 [Terriglobales bacterium]|nr:hypothetical protein [Terriglobales bacterium]